MSSKYQISKGSCAELGATVQANGVNFAIWCPNAKVMELLLFKSVDDKNPKIIELSEAIYRSSYYWHVFVSGITDGQLYGWRVKEVIKQGKGIVYDPLKVLIDPYAKRIVFPENYSRSKTSQVGSNTAFCAKGVVIDSSKYNWDSDVAPNHPLSTNIIYEMHVAGFTKDKSSNLSENIRGTYKGLVEKIPYLKELGVNTVELLPIFQFDIYDALPGKENYWGYAPMSFFAIHADYSSNKDIYGPLDEFRDMVKALHKAGIEVFLDVVYNHTSEGGETGPLYSYKGLDNESYYILDEKGEYKNYSGCGNTLNASHPMVKRLINDSLHFWTQEMHVDGFRFDLACILSRATDGEPLNDPPTTLAIDSDYRLADVKLIAEPWDAGGLYQVGQMAGRKWREWNGQFRDDLRRFLRGDRGMIKKFVSRLLGSPDIYTDSRLDPYKSINFITCHDGFTLWDLVSYNEKHNVQNGEGNRDGNDANFSTNYGVEGETFDKNINTLRVRQAKNFMLLNLFSMGIPMVLMGDEVLRTQKGNNNAYCQDNELSYLKWDRLGAPQEMFRFTKALMNIRALRGDKNYELFSLKEKLDNNHFEWHGILPNQPDWSDDSHSIGMTFYSQSQNAYYYIFINAYWEGLHIKLPNVPNSPNQKWQRVIDTSLPPPLDVVENREDLDKVKIGHNYFVESRTILVLVAYCDDAKKC